MYNREVIIYISKRIVMTLGKNMKVVDLNVLINEKTNQIIVQFLYNVNDRCSCECNNVSYSRLFSFKPNNNMKNVANKIVDKVVNEIDRLMN